MEKKIVADKRPIYILNNKYSHFFIVRHLKIHAIYMAEKKILIKLKHIP